MEFQKVLFKSVLWRGLLYFSQLVLNILIARYYEPEGSGWIFYNLNNYAFILLVLSICIDSGMGYYLARNTITPAKLFTLSLLWTIVVAILAALILGIYPYRPAEDQTIFFAGSLSFIVGSILITFFSALFFARKNFITPNAILLSVNILVAVLFIFSRGNSDLINKNDFLYIYIFSFLAQGILLTIFFRLSYLKRSRFQLPSSPEMKLLVRYSLLAFLGNILTFLVFRSDYWFIDYFDRSANEMGNYIQVSKIVQLFFAVPSFLASAVFPLTAGAEKGLIENIKTLSRLLFISCFVGCVALAITGKWLFPLVFGEGFIHMYIPFLLSIPGIIAISLAYPLAGYFSGIHKLRINIYSSLIALMIIVAGNIIFIPVYGINAAAAVSSVGYASLFIFLLQVFRKENNSPVGDYFSLRANDIVWIKKIFLKKPVDE